MRSSAVSSCAAVIVPSSMACAPACRTMGASRMMAGPVASTAAPTSSSTSSPAETARRGIARPTKGCATRSVKARFSAASTSRSTSEVIRVAWSESSSRARPPGRSTRANSLTAACGSSRCCSTRSHQSTSTLASGSGRAVASASRKRAPLPDSPARSWARSRSTAFGSIPVTLPSGPTRPASSRVTVPGAAAHVQHHVAAADLGDADRPVTQATDRGGRRPAGRAASP